MGNAVATTRDVFLSAGTVVIDLAWTRLLRTRSSAVVPADFIGTLFSNKDNMKLFTFRCTNHELEAPR